MQEEVENRTVTLSINATKMTGRVLKEALRKYLAYQKAKSQGKAYKDVKPTGKQSVKQLILKALIKAKDVSVQQNIAKMKLICVMHEMH